MNDAPAVILASGSRTRYELLKHAGVAFTVVPADLDEDAIRNSLIDETGDAPDASDVADILARAKGEMVSAANPESLVIAADQTLSCDGEFFTKPDDQDAARETLMKLRGKRHQLHTSVVIARKGDVTWALSETAHLTMRKFSATFVAQYLLRAGSDVCESVGAYQLEGLGIQLFDQIEGDYFSILGLPLLPLIQQLRSEGVLTS